MALDLDEYLVAEKFNDNLQNLLKGDKRHPTAFFLVVFRSL